MPEQDGGPHGHVKWSPGRAPLGTTPSTLRPSGRSFLTRVTPGTACGGDHEVHHARRCSLEAAAAAAARPPGAAVAVAARSARRLSGSEIVTGARAPGGTVDRRPRSRPAAESTCWSPALAPSGTVTVGHGCCGRRRRGRRALQWRWRRRGRRARQWRGRTCPWPPVVALGGDASGAGAATSGPGSAVGAGAGSGAGSGPATGGIPGGAASSVGANSLSSPRGWFARLDASGEGQKTVP